MRKSLAERFWAKVDRNGPVPAHRPELGPCWAWTGAVSAGYGVIVTGRRGATLRMRAHRLAWWLWHGRWPDPCALHHCDNPLCVRRDHLFEGTRTDNNADMTAKGRNADTKGEKNPAHKVTADQVREIRLRYAEGGISQQRLGDEFGLTQGIVSHMITRRTWKSVE